MRKPVYCTPVRSLFPAAQVAWKEPCTTNPPKLPKIQPPVPFPRDFEIPPKYTPPPPRKRPFWGFFEALFWGGTRGGTWVFITLLGVRN